MSRALRFLLPVAWAAISLGCQGTPPAAEERIGSPPQDLQLQRVLLSGDIPLDADSNGYPDTLRAFAYLFGDQNVYPLPVHAPGRFDFTLSAPSGESIARWSIDEQTASAARRRNEVGGVYVFVLDLRTASTDRLPFDVYMLEAAFEGLGQRVVSSPLRMQLGRQ